MAEENGGAILCDEGSPLIKSCVFVNCAAGAGGGICTLGSAVITDCTFIGNSVDHLEYGGLGGALAVRGTSPVSVVNCTFIDNYSEDLGGAVFVDEGSAVSFTNCTFCGNEAVDGSGINLSGTGQAALVNTIVAFGAVGEAVVGTGSIEITYSNVFGNAGGDWTGPISGQLGVNGNISEDPLFVGPANWDCHLPFTSPCRDSGDNNATGLSDHDMEGDPRVAWDGTVDMGADEFYTHLYITGIMTAGGEIQGKLIGLPGTTPVALFIGFDMREVPVQTPYGDFYILPPKILLPLIPIPSSGIIQVTTTIPLTPPGPYKVPMQALIGLNSDSLTNPYVLEVR